MRGGGPGAPDADGVEDAAAFRAALLAVPPQDRDAWVDGRLGLGAIPADGPDLPRGCVPYLPCSVDAIVRIVDGAGVRPADVFVDVGSGVGRATALVHLLTGARTVGIEIQRGLAASARDLASRLRLRGMTTIEGDATELIASVAAGSVFFLYCPFGGPRLAQVLGELEAIARTRPIRVACVDLPLPPCEWLARDAQTAGDAAIYRSRG